MKKEPSLSPSRSASILMCLLLLYAEGDADTSEMIESMAIRTTEARYSPTASFIYNSKSKWTFPEVSSTLRLSSMDMSGLLIFMALYHLAAAFVGARMSLSDRVSFTKNAQVSVKA